MTDKRGFWLRKKVLVTGASGFLASHLIEKLISLGAQVRAFVRTNSRNDLGLLSVLPTEVFSALEITFGDLRDLYAVQQAVQDQEYVFHLGALISIPYSYMRPAEVVETNVMGTLNVLQAARHLPVRRIIHTSSSEVYGTALRVPIDEDHPLQGQSPYSASKIGADKLAESFYRAYDLPVVTLRPFNTFGPRQSARAVIPTIITQALTQNIVYIGNLAARRDFTYVDDTIAGFLKVGEVEGVEGETINLGRGVDIRIGDLAKEIISIVGKPVKLSVTPERERPPKSEVERLLSDNSKAKKILGWKPEVSLRKGLENTIEWVEQNLHHYRPGKYEI